MPPRGFALAFLLWMLAAMSLLVSGLISLSRSDVQLTSVHLDTARAAAAGRGAAHLLMRDFLAARGASDESTDVFVREYQVGGLRVLARVMPAGAFVSLNGASEELLARVFQYAAELPASDAEVLASSVVAYRTQGVEWSAEDSGPASEGALPFTAVEDLLRVPGMTRSVYDRIYLLVHALRGGSSSIDPLLAPEALLQSLAGGDAGAVEDVARARQQGRRPEGVPEGLEFAGSAAADREFCLDMLVIFEDERSALQRIWAEESSGFGAMQWSITRALPVKMAANNRHLSDTVESMREAQANAG